MKVFMLSMVIALWTSVSVFACDNARSNANCVRAVAMPACVVVASARRTRLERRMDRVSARLRARRARTACAIVFRACD